MCCYIFQLTPPASKKSIMHVSKVRVVIWLCKAITSKLIWKPYVSATHSVCDAICKLVKGE